MAFKWPKNPDGSNKKMGDLTKAQQAQIFKEAAAKLGPEFADKGIKLEFCDGNPPLSSIRLLAACDVKADVVDHKVVKLRVSIDDLAIAQDDIDGFDADDHRGKKEFDDLASAFDDDKEKLERISFEMQKTPGGKWQIAEIAFS